MSIRIINLTAMPCLRYPALDADGAEFSVFMVKGTFDIDIDGNSFLSSDQEPINFVDQTYGELNKTALRYPSEFVPYKPETDIIFDCVAYNLEKSLSWVVGIQLSDEFGVRVEKKIRIHGNRYWLPRWKRSLTDTEKVNWKKYRSLFQGWELTVADLIPELEIRYEHAFGGLMPKDKGKDGQPFIEAYQYNPVGCGWIDPEWTDHTKPVLAPQIEDPDVPFCDPYMLYSPAGLGPIPPAWLPRRPLGGTFDQNWVDHVWPKWPKDYSFFYNNAACHGLRIPGSIQGDITIELVGLHPQNRNWLIKIQNPVPYVALKQDDGWRYVQMSLDTIFFDLGNYSEGDYRIYAIWRTVFDYDHVKEIQLNCIKNKNFSISTGLLESSPTPKDITMHRKKERKNG